MMLFSTLFLVLCFCGSAVFAQTTRDVNPSQSIQAAIDAASNGDTIRLIAQAPADPNDVAVFNENIVVNKELTITSAGGRNAKTIVGSNGSNLATILISSSDVIIQGLTVVGFDHDAPGLEKAAIYCQEVLPVTNVEIRDNRITAAGEAGLLVSFGTEISAWIIDGNIFDGKTYVGPNPAGEGFSNQFNLENVPRQLVTLGNSQGDIASAKATAITFTNNEVIGQTGDLNGEDPSVPQGNTCATLDVASSTISGNTFRCTTARFGTQLRLRRPGTVVTGNTFSGAVLDADQDSLVGHAFFQNQVPTFINEFLDANTFVDPPRSLVDVVGTTVGPILAGEKDLCEPVNTFGICPPTSYGFVADGETFCISFGTAFPAATALTDVNNCAAVSMTTTSSDPVLAFFDGTAVSFDTTCEIRTDEDGQIGVLLMVDASGRSVNLLACNSLDVNDGLGTRKRATTSLTVASTPAFSTAASADGDPHIVGGRGQKFDFFGRPNAIYTLLSAPQFVVNMQMLSYGPKDRFIGAAFVHFRNVTLRFDTGAYKPHKMQARVDHKIAHLGDEIKVKVRDQQMEIDICSDYRIVLRQRWDITHQGGNRLFHVDVSVDVPGCHNHFGGVLGETYRCDGEFEWNRAREEEFRVGFGHSVPHKSTFSARAPCFDADEFAGRQRVKGNTGSGSP